MKRFKVFYGKEEFAIKAEQIEVCVDGSIFYINGEVVAVFPRFSPVILVEIDTPKQE